MEHLYRAYDMLDRELEDVISGDGKISRQEDICLIKDISGGMKNLLTVAAMLEAEDGYSRDGYDGMSGARRGGRTRGMSRGQYDSRVYDGGRSYAGRKGYSRDNEMDKVMAKIEEVKHSIERMGDD